MASSSLTLLPLTGNLYSLKTVHSITSAATLHLHSFISSLLLCHWEKLKAPITSKNTRRRETGGGRTVKAVFRRILFSLAVWVVDS